MTALSITAGRERARTLFPGVLACAVVAAASTFLSEHYGAPVMLFALLLGMAMNFLSGDGPCQPGIEFTAKQLLRVGVALLGLRITLGQVVELGWQPLAIVVLTVALTIGVSMAVARLMGFQSLFGLLSGGATAICGASAALALAAALPNHPLKERAVLFTVVGVSALSTLALRDSGHAAAHAMAKRLAAARQAFLDTVDFVVANAKSDPNAAFAGSVPYLLLAGNLVAGWQLGRALLVAERKLAAGEDAEFMRNKIAVARFYAEHVLTRVPGLRDSVVSGAAAINDVPLQAF
jgi:Acetyl-CoA dehydrogenase C-terminal like/Conserved hypothetical protein 698